jgi:hypothetical protein
VRNTDRRAVTLRDGSVWPEDAAVVGTAPPRRATAARQAAQASSAHRHIGVLLSGPVAVADPQTRQDAMDDSLLAETSWSVWHWSFHVVTTS